MYKVAALCGKAGAGKDSLLREVMRRKGDRFNEIISCTTRPRRENEIDGKNYHFMTNQEFYDCVMRGDMLEAAEFNGWYYGTLKSALAANKINIGVFNPDGIESLQLDPSIDLTIFYITCSDKQRLLRQLNREANPNVREIIRRYTTDEEDFYGLEDEFSCNIYRNENPQDKATFATFIGQFY